MGDLIDGRRRVVIEGVQPLIDGGRFPIKRVIGDWVIVEADAFADGHDQVECRLLYRREADAGWSEVPMRSLGNDRWRAEFQVMELGRYRYTVEGWISRFGTWRAALRKRIEAGQNVQVDLLIGAELIEASARQAPAPEAELLRAWAHRLREPGDMAARAGLAMDDTLGKLTLTHTSRELASRFALEPEVVVDRMRARYSTWYEMFPRSSANEPGRHGSFKDCEAWLPYIADMGFDVLYFPPIHPIGTSFRKGRNNSVTAQPDDVGSPWAIGGEEGGHTAIHPELGTLDDFRRLMERARTAGLEIALDLAYQCTPDHPWVRDHPEWFRKRPDGTIQYAENPPKKYQDIYPIDFETPAWRELWDELLKVILFWAEQGVRILRVDNPHTKPFPFWEWALGKVKAQYPDMLFLSEAFTRPKVMYRLAKLGFSQSYTYFTWRNTKAELTEYFTELTQSEVREYFRPNLWPNTPDILHEFLQVGGRSAFAIRLVLAATLGANYGIYGPAYELGENTPYQPGSEEYLNSEKYELKQRDLNASHSLRPLITRVNQARRDHPALQRNDTLRFHPIDNPMLLCYSKTTPDLSDVVITVVSLDPAHAQAGWLELDLDALGIPADQALEVEDLLAKHRFLWQGRRNYVEVAPPVPARLLLAHRRMRTERDFDYFA
jgi:starch synthase (maltosyl-transferring)